MVYSYKSNVRIPVDAQTAGNEISRLRTENEGFFSPAVVVEASRPENAALHDVFEWNDALAAESFRLDQARYVIRSIVVTSLSHAMSSEDLRRQVLARALSELQQFQRKYADFVEFAGIVKAIVEAKAKINKEMAA